MKCVTLIDPATQLTKMAVDQSCNRFQIPFIRYLVLPHQRLLLDGNPIISEKPAKSDDLTSARSEGAHGNNKVARKAGIHQSWADMVKSRPPNQANAGLQPLNKR
jgi:hypothetical protein